MFFMPNVSASTVAGGAEPYEHYSDWHKDAFGCRPGADQSARYDAMSPIERKVEHETIIAWFAEDDRISALREEVAKFDFTRRMEYLMRREGVSEREAFKQTCSAGNAEYLGSKHGFDWGYVCYHWHLPYSYEGTLKAKWEELQD